MRNAEKKVAAFAFSWQGDPDLVLLAGSGFTAGDVDSGARVCLVSQDLAIHLYSSEQNAVGQSLTVAGSRFEVVGVPDPNSGTGGKGYFGGSYYFVLPYTTFRNLAPESIDGLLIWTQSPQAEEIAKRTTLAALARTHGAYSKYRVDSIREQLKQQERIIGVIVVSLTAIGAISLIVAGLGITNIMLVSVTERTREIGIRSRSGPVAARSWRSS